MDNNTLKKVSPQAPVMRDRLTKEDKDIIRGAFRDEWITLTVIRDLFFGFNLSEWEMGIVKGLPATVKKVLRKVLFPELSKENPIGSSTNADMWSSIQIMGVTPEVQVQNIQARGELLEIVTKAFNSLENPDGNRIDLGFSGTTKEIPKFIARNTFINYIEQQLVLLNAIAYSVDETPDEQKERQKKDSVR